MTDPIPARVAALKTMPMPELKAQWRALFETEPPQFNRRAPREPLAYRIQELAYGGLKPETLRRLEILGEQYDSDNVTTRRIRHDARPVAGTRLVREYRGIEHTVTVLADGYEWRGPALPLALGHRPRHHRHAVERARVLRASSGRGARHDEARSPASSAARSTPASPPRKGWSRSSTRCTPSARPARPMSPASAPRAGR